MKRHYFPIIILILLLTCCSAFAATDTIGPWGIDAAKPEFKNLSTCLSSPLTVGQTIVIRKPMAINNKTITGNRQIKVIAGGRIEPAVGKTVTFALDSSFDAGKYQAFGGSGTVTGLKESRPEWFGVNTTPGVSNMTAAVQAAINAAPDVSFQPGVYLIDTVTLAENTRLRGAGIDKTVIKQGTTVGASYGTFYAESGSSSTYIANIHISDMTIDGQVASKGFSEFEHLASLSGVKDAVIERVKFLGFRGDGLYIGSGHAAGTERHNVNLVVQHCIFDGVNNDNRNGISVIDVNGLTINNNRFVNCTKLDMPGAIDVEPDGNVYHIIKDIKIAGNKFLNNSGSSGSISVYLPDVAWTVPPSGFLIDGNEIEGTGAAGGEPGLFFVHAGDATASRNHALRIVNNKIYRTGRGFRLFGVNNVVFSGNTITDTFYGPLLGYSAAGNKVMNAIITNNTFKQIASDNTAGGGGIDIFTVDYLTISKNIFIDCGKASGTAGYCLDFNTGTSSYVTLEDNKFEDLGNVITVAIQKGAGHTFTAATNKGFRNELISCTGNAFQSAETDVRTAYTPILTGETTAGTGTYTTQVGFYTRIGKAVFFEVELIWTGHDGTGQMDISLPFTADPAVVTYVPLSVASSGITLAAGAQMQAYVYKSTSMIRLFTSNAGVLTAQGVVSSGTLWISGSYLAQ